jgi:alcohol dehydrogenase class IV
MLGKLQMPVRLGELGVDASHVQDVVRTLPKNLYATNTRRLTPPQITALITGAI